MSRYCVSQNGLTLLWRLTPELPKTTSASRSWSSRSARVAARRRSISGGEKRVTRAGATPTPAAARATASRARPRPRVAPEDRARRRTWGTPAARPTARAATAHSARRRPTSYGVGDAARRLRPHLRQLGRVLQLVEHPARHHDRAVS